MTDRPSSGRGARALCRSAPEKGCLVVCRVRRLLQSAEHRGLAGAGTAHEDTELTCRDPFKRLCLFGSAPRRNGGSVRSTVTPCSRIVSRSMLVPMAPSRLAMRRLRALTAASAKDAVPASSHLTSCRHRTSVSSFAPFQLESGRSRFRCFADCR